MPSRREFLAAAGGTGAAVAMGSAAVAGSAAAQSSPTESVTPSHVTHSFEADLLERYRPLLITRDLGSNTPSALYAFVSRSTEFEHTVLSYWAEYPFQRGVALGWDSHLGDHEPVIVRVDEEAGEIVDVSFSAYHWLRGWTPEPSTNDNSTGTHPTLHIVDPWHHYFTTVEEGVTVQLEHLSHDVLDSWWVNGWSDAVYLRGVAVPWEMMGSDGRSDWWADSMSAFSYEATLRRFVYPYLYGVDDRVEIDVGGRSR